MKNVRICKSYWLFLFVMLNMSASVYGMQSGTEENLAQYKSSTIPPSNPSTTLHDWEMVRRSDFMKGTPVILINRPHPEEYQQQSPPSQANSVTGATASRLVTLEELLLQDGSKNSDEIKASLKRRLENLLDGTQISDILDAPKLPSEIRAQAIIGQLETLLQSQQTPSSYKFWFNSLSEIINNPDIHNINVKAVARITQNNMRLSGWVDDQMCRFLDAYNSYEEIRTNPAIENINRYMADLMQIAMIKAQIIPITPDLDEDATKRFIDFIAIKDSLPTILQQTITNLTTYVHDIKRSSLQAKSSIVRRAIGFVYKSRYSYTPGLTALVTRELSSYLLQSLFRVVSSYIFG